MADDKTKDGDEFDVEEVLFDVEAGMEDALDFGRTEIRGLHTGKASVVLLDPISVDCYDTQMPLKEVATVSVPEPRMLSVNVWDKDNVKNVERAIAKADMGLNPIVEGNNIRLPLPDVTEERRMELVRIVNRVGEETKIKVRNARMEGRNKISRAEKANPDKTGSQISEDERKGLDARIQGLTDKYIGMVEEMIANKVKEVNDI